jgi:hypothetical protein
MTSAHGLDNTILVWGLLLCEAFLNNQCEFSSCQQSHSLYFGYWDKREQTIKAMKCVAMHQLHLFRRLLLKCNTMKVWSNSQASRGPQRSMCKINIILVPAEFQFSTTWLWSGGSTWAHVNLRMLVNRHTRRPRYTCAVHT